MAIGPGGNDAFCSETPHGSRQGRSCGAVFCFGADLLPRRIQDYLTGHAAGCSVQTGWLLRAGNPGPSCRELRLSAASTAPARHRHGSEHGMGSGGQSRHRVWSYAAPALGCAPVSVPTSRSALLSPLTDAAVTSMAPWNHLVWRGDHITLHFLYRLYSPDHCMGETGHISGAFQSCIPCA